MNSTTFSISFSGLLLYALIVLTHAEDIPATDDRSLYIESETKAVSPQCLMDKGDQDEDKKRTEVGIGEVVGYINLERQAIKGNRYGLY